MASLPHEPESKQFLAAQLQATLNVIPAYTWYANPSGGLTFVNKRQADYLGLPKEHPLRSGMDTGAAWDSHLTFLHQDDQEHTRRIWSECLRTGSAIELSFRVRNGDGAYRWFLCRAEPVRAANGALLCWIGVNLDIEERKQAEFELRRSRGHLADAQKLSRTGCVGMERSTKRIFWSEEAARIYGYPPGTEPTPELILQRSHPDDVGILKEVLERAAQGVNDFDWEHRLLMPDGSVKHLHDLAHCFRDEAGNEEIVGAIMDITEHKLADESLRQSEERFRLVLDGIGAHVIAATLEGEIEFANQPCLDYFGKTLEELKRWQTSGDVLHPNDLASAIAVWGRSIEQGVSYDVDYRFRRSDGVYHWFHVRGRPQADAQGSVVRWYALLTDIDERKKAEQRLEAQEREHRQVLDLSPQVIAVFGPRFERLFSNQTGLDYFGLTLDEWRGTAPGAVSHPDDVKRFHDQWERAVSGGLALEIELRLRKSDGSYHWFLARYNPVRDEQGQVSRWYVAATDIDDRKRAEERLEQENVALREEIDRASMFEEIVGTSPALRAVLVSISKVAPSDSTVLVTGETGTGKELVARAIHRRSHRSSRAFVSVNCAAIPRDLIASELFGHEKGAFTGALQRRVGRFELAESGTIFLDEVGELSPDAQVALLRVLQEREFERVGGGQSIRVDVRVIAATNRDLKTAVAKGAYREDLYYRLNVFPIEMPPLRARREDIPLLVEYFVDRYARKAGKSIRRVDKKTLQLLQSYPWPGNIRELQNIIERSLIVCETETFTVDESWLSQRPLDTRSGDRPLLSAKVAATEREIIEEALRSSQGRIFGPSGAAAKLGIARSTLESKIRSLKINKNRFKVPSGT